MSSKEGSGEGLGFRRQNSPNGDTNTSQPCALPAKLGLEAKHRLMLCAYVGLTLLHVEHRSMVVSGVSNRALESVFGGWPRGRGHDSEPPDVVLSPRSEQE